MNNNIKKKKSWPPEMLLLKMFKNMPFFRGFVSENKTKAGNAALSMHYSA